MKIEKWNQSRLYLRRDPDAGWTLAVWRWRIFFQVVVVTPPPICADTGAPKHPGNCWNVRCQLGGTCCRADGVKAADLPKPDCWAILTPNGSRLVPPGEAKGRKDAYRLFSEEQVRELLHSHGVPEVPRG